MHIQFIYARRTINSRNSQSCYIYELTCVPCFYEIILAAPLYMTTIITSMRIHKTYDSQIARQTTHHSVGYQSRGLFQVHIHGDDLLLGHGPSIKKYLIVASSLVAA
jgi:hypothetical protein